MSEASYTTTVPMLPTRRLRFALWRIRRRTDWRLLVIARFNPYVARELRRSVSDARKQVQREALGLPVR